jgi:thioredoxin-related protein
MQIMSLNRQALRSIGKQKPLLIILLLMFALGSSSLFSAVYAEELNWKDVDTGLREAKSLHKYALADVYTDWCGWCKKLDRDTFTNTAMVRFLNEKFVCIKANAEDNAQGQKLAGQYGVNGFPCALVFDQSGTLIGKISGYRDAAAYEKALNDLIAHPNAQTAQ